MAHARRVAEKRLFAVQNAQNDADSQKIFSFTYVTVVKQNTPNICLWEPEVEVISKFVSLVGSHSIDKHGVNCPKIGGDEGGVYDAFVGVFSTMC